MADSATIAREIYYYNVSYTTVESEKGMAGDFRKMYKEQYRSVISCLFGKWNGAVKSKNVWLLYIVTLLHRYHSSKTVTTEVNVTTDWRYTRKLRSKTSQKNTQVILCIKYWAWESCPYNKLKKIVLSAGKDGCRVRLFRTTSAIIRPLHSAV